MMRTGMRGLAAVASLMALSALGTTAPALADAPKNNSERMICKSAPKEGSRFRTRTCHTKAEWDQIAQENHRLMNEMAGRTIKACGPQNGCD